MGQLGGSNSSSRAVPKWAVPYEQQFTNIGNQELAQYAASGGNNNPQITAGNQQISATLAGQYADPSSNPNLAATGQAIEQGANLQYQQMAGQNNRAANASGMLLSSADAAVNATTQQNINQNVTGQLSQLYGQNYAAERQNQLQAASASINQGQMPYNQAIQLGQMFSGFGSSGSRTDPSLLGYVL